MSMAQTINRRLSSLGVPGIAGIGIMIACVAFYDGAIRPLQQQVAKRQQLLDERQFSVKAAPRAHWRMLHDYLPQEGKADELAATIYRLAEAAQIVLREAEYKEERLDKTRMAVRHLDFSVRGDYFQVRQFLSSMLNEIPALALDTISFQKSRDAQGLLDVRIAMSLYLAR